MSPWLALLEIDPNWVKPGWTPLLVTLLLLAALVFLLFSMRRQMRKITVPHADEIEPDDQPADPAAGEPGPGAREDGRGSR